MEMKPQLTKKPPNAPRANFNRHGSGLPLLSGNYKEAYEKMFGMLEDSGWQLKMEGDEDEADLLNDELLQSPAEALSQGY